jgi:spore coat polysaccharide biosynthesis protein SpsF
MRVEIYVQARMGSTRLPGKVMMKVLGKPLLGYLLERLAQVRKADAVVVLTTTTPADDAIVDFCVRSRVPCYRGPEEDVLARYRYVAEKRKPDAIVRITADCPLIDPDEVDRVIATYLEFYPSYDYVSNCFERSYPRGLDTEIFSFDALEQAFVEGKSRFEKEHVTPFIYQHPERFILKNVTSPEPLGHHRWTVDTPEDFALIQTILERLYPVYPDFRTKDIVNLFKKHPELMQINAHIKQKLS